MSGLDPILTIACVVRNQAGALAAFHSKLAGEAQRFSAVIDILYVDDGSNDGTDEVLRRIAIEDQRVRVLRLSRPFGYHGSTSAALAHAPGDATILVLSTRAPLSVIPTLVDHWHQGFELVWAMRFQEAGLDNAGWRRFVAFMSRKLKLPMVEDVEAGLFSKRIVDLYRSLPHRGEHVPSTLASYGFPQATIKVFEAESPRDPCTRKDILRALGERLVDHSILPVRLVSGLGVLLGIVAFLYSFVIIFRSIFFGLGDYGWPSQAITLLFLGSAQMISLGIIVEYVWRIFQQTRQAPRYIIKDRLGVPMRAPPTSWIIDPHDLDVSSAAGRK
jgi:polyisoprenyl-phosphate glycosyltransferase